MLCINKTVVKSGIIPSNNPFTMKPTIIKTPKLKRIFAAVAVVLCLASCQKSLSGIPDDAPDHNLVIKFNAVVDTADLVLGEEYRNIFNEPFTVSAFKYYVHAIQLINTDSAEVFELPKDKYYLVDFSDSASTMIKAGVHPYKYNRIAFTIGVDSARNVSGAQTDALDPTKGMFWTWNTGSFTTLIIIIAAITHQL